MQWLFVVGRAAQKLKSVFGTIIVTAGLLLGASLSANATPLQDFIFGGTTPWFVQSAVSHDDVDAHQSGAISHSQSSWMESTVTGPGAVRFWWKVSSESCCDPLNFYVDGVSQADIRGAVDWQSKSFAVPDGNHSLRWSYSTDGSVLTGSNAGWVDQVTFEQGSDIDVTPPLTSATPAEGMYVSSQSVTLSANEPATIYYTTNGSDPTTTSSQYSSPLTISSTTTLKFFAVDATGNAELAKSAAYTFDTTAPTTSTSLSGGSYAGARSVSLYCSDYGMGCNNTYYCLGSNCTPTTLYNSAFPITASTDLRYYSTDRGGNAEAVKTSTYTIAADTTAPVTTPGYGSGTYGAFYTYLYCSDGDGSGCASTLYCLGTGCTPSTNYNSSIYVTNSTDFRFFSQDKAGNSESVQTVSYIIDKTPPVTTASPSGGSYQTAPLVTLTCSDGTGKGCSSTYYCKGETCSPTTYYSGSISINDTTVLRYYSRDNAYNDESVVTQSYVNPSPHKTITVPGMYSAIQAAIDAAYNGDTVQVAPGIYVENINFNGKAITVVSSGGAEVTILDGNQSRSVVTFSSGEDSNSILDGFTIRNGSAGSSYPYDGGGIYISYASPTVRNNKITANSADWGGGIYVGFGSPLIRNNVITLNHSSTYGGGVHVGGAASAQIINNVISENNSSDGGGGISMWSAGTPTISGNSISRNTAYSEGGGIWMVNGTDPLIVQNLIADNASAYGSAIYWLASSSGPYLVNNTIFDSNSSQGSVVYADGYDANVRLINNVVAASGSRTAIYCGSSNDINPPQFSHNVVYSPASDAFGGYCTNQNGINGNITADPRLSSPQAGYYGLLAGSPAIDAGDNSALSLPTMDFSGLTRIIEGNGEGTATVDIGAYEFVTALPVATLQGIPTEFLTTNSLTITFGGIDVVSYRYALDGGAFSTADIAVATPISLTNLTNGQHSIAVLGKNSVGSEQLLSSATAATWVVNTETTNLTFTNGGTANWFVQPTVSRDGIAYQSGAVGSNQPSWMETTVTGPGAIRFWWKTSPQYNGDSLMFSIDGASQSRVYGDVDWQNKAYAISSGSHTLRWTYSAGPIGSTGSSSGWLDQITFEQGSNIDVTPPVSSATPVAGIYGTSQSVTLSCSDGSGSGCSGTFYCKGSGCNPNTPYSSPITISSATDLRFYSTDLSGNYELVKTATYSFDTALPSTYSSLSAGSYSGPRDVTLYCSDYEMGCSTTFYCLGSGCTPTTPYSTAIAIITSTDLRYYSVDRGGNSEAVKTTAFTITPDVTQPVTSSSYASGAYRPMSVYLSCNDGVGSGCAATYYCIGAGCTPSTLTNGNFIGISYSTDLRYYSVDRSGNSEAVKTASYIMIIDPPAVTTGYAWSIFATGATIFGSVNRNGADTTVTFDYGLTTGYGNSESGGTLTSESGTSSISTNLSGLACGTTYHFRVTATNSAGTTLGQDQTFTTSICPINGICGGSNGGSFSVAPTSGLCASGSPSAITGTGPWTWSCIGYNSQVPNAECTASAAPQQPVTVFPVSWRQTAGPYGGYISALVIDPTNSQVIYAGTFSGGVFKSTNGGADWTAVNNGLTSTSISSLAIDPNNGQTLYATTDGGFSGTVSVGIFKSTNGGTSWSSISSGMAVSGYSAIAVDQTDSQVVYAGTSNGVYKSTNGGVSWNVASSGLPAYRSDITTIAIDSTNSQTLYAGTYGSTQGVLFKSNDGGANWSSVYSSATYTSVKSIVVDSTNSQTIYAVLYGIGVNKSTDGGTTWTAINSLLATPKSLAIDPTNSQVVYAAASQGLFKSANGGTSWSLLYTGLPTASAYRLAIDPTNSQTVYVGNYPGGILKSINAGSSWTAMNNGLAATSINAIAVDPLSSQTAYAGTCESVFKTTNGGTTWTAINNGVTNTDISSIAVNQSDSQTIYIGTWGGGVFKTTNGGISWTALNSGLTSLDVMSLALDPVNSHILYAGTNGGGIFKSSDGGGTWNSVHNESIHTFAIDPTNSQTVYAGGWGGIFKTTNGGANWTAVNSGMTASSVNALAIDPANSQTLYAATISGLYKSVNGGTTWTGINSGLTTTNIYFITIDPVSSQILYAATLGGGVFKSADGGTSWSPINGGLPYRDVVSLAIDPLNRQTVYAGMVGGGIFKTVTYTISGKVTQNGSALAGVTFSGASCTTTDSSGAYICSVAPGWNGTITPTLVGSIFTPASQSYNDIAANQIAQNFAVNPLITSINVTTVTGGNGTVSCTSPVNAGADSTCTITPAKGFQLATFTDNNVDRMTLVSAGGYTITNVTTDHTIVATFSDSQKPVITAFTIPAGSRSPNIVSLTLTASDNVGVTGYHVSEIATAPAASAPVWGGVQPAGYFFSGEGSKTLYAFAKDAAGNVSNVASAMTIIDTTGPVVTLSTLPDGAVTNNATLNVSGTVADIIGVADLLLNNTVVTLTNGSFSHAVTLVSGANTIRIITTDTLGNSSSTTRTVTLDKAAPLLTVSAPVDNSKTAQLLATVTGTVDETATVTVTLNSGTAQSAAMNGTSFTHTVSLAAGNNAITIIATDLGGNKTTAVRTVTYDNTAPSIAITNPAQDITTPQAGMVLYGTVSDALTAVTVTMTVNSQTYLPTIIGGNFSQNISFTAEGIYTVVVTATDEAGNSSSATRNIIYALPVNGVCGKSHGTGQRTAPIAGLCAGGTAAAVTGTGPWNWSCAGLYGGTTATCATTPTSFDPLPDGIINPAPGKTGPDITDALMVLHHISGGPQLTAVQAANADIAPYGSDGRPLGNGVTDIADVIMILRRVAGIGNW